MTASNSVAIIEWQLRSEAFLESDIIQFFDLGLRARDRDSFRARIDSDDRALVSQPLRKLDHVSAGPAVDV